MAKQINLDWTKHLPEGVGATSRLASIIAEAQHYQSEAGELAARAKQARALAVKTARRAERMIAELWATEEIEAAKKAAGGEG